MHELSIVQSIVQIVTAEATAAHSQLVEEVELDIGTMSGIELSAFHFAWSQAVKNTVMADAKPIINSIEGKAQCMMCDTSFLLDHYSTPCPNCGSHFIDIQQGKELRVKAISVR